jgi:hypothetical protein
MEPQSHPGGFEEVKKYLFPLSGFERRIFQSVALRRKICKETVVACLKVYPSTLPSTLAVRRIMKVGIIAVNCASQRVETK